MRLLIGFAGVLVAVTAGGGSAPGARGLGADAPPMLAAVQPAYGASSPAQFDHAKHAALFSNCTDCHTGVTTDAMFPEPTFCAACHDGTMQPVVAYRGRTPRSAANLKFRHAAHPLVETCETCHGSAQSGAVRPVVQRCLDCHGIQTAHQDAATDCRVCHASPPKPASHDAGWRSAHRVEAAAAPETCATCHVRSECLDCHRPGAGSPGGGYHPADFLTRHPADAYSRQTECSTCHNVADFCQDCHRQAGVVARGPLSGGFHDANRSFLGGHGQAARQSLESCVTCHTERDCLQCHAQFNPHGPGFDADSWRHKAPQMCAACHIGGIPGGG